MLSFPRGTKMFQFPRLSSLTYVFSQGLRSITCVGFAHSGISGSAPVSGSPKLIATCYALHRLLAPRNPPQALLRLTNKISSATSNDIQLSKNDCPKGIFDSVYLFRRPMRSALRVGYGGERVRTDDLLRARQALSQLSYTPRLDLFGFVATFIWGNWWA